MIAEPDEIAHGETRVAEPPKPVGETGCHAMIARVEQLFRRKPLEACLGKAVDELRRYSVVAQLAEIVYRFGYLLANADVIPTWNADAEFRAAREAALRNK